MSNALVVNDPNNYCAEAQLAIAKASGTGYKISCPNGEAKLVRDVDFGVVPGTKSPSLFKSGAEKLCMAYGLLQQFEIESKIEQVGKDGAFFYYMVKCKLVKVVNGQEYIFSSGYGSSNTNEKRNGRNSAYDAANATLKMAEKRALVDAALHISGLSDAFTQDMENESFMNKADLVTKATPDSPITQPQLKRIYAICGDEGIPIPEAKKILKEMGYPSAKDIKQGEYDSVIEYIKAKVKGDK